jgi:DNA-directed RNA polymerase specialized sigma24 family protein
MLMTDREIFEGLSRQDRTTTEYVYKTLAPPIFKYVLSNNGTREEAKDLFQETYIKVLQKIQDDQYRHREKFEAYFIDHLRVKKRRVAVGDNDFLLQRADEADEDALLQLILHDARLEALHQVWNVWEDTDCRRILQRFHYDNIRTKDLAISEETSQNTLLQRLFKCRSKLFRLVSRQLEKIQVS